MYCTTLSNKVSIPFQSSNPTLTPWPPPPPPPTEKHTVQLIQDILVHSSIQPHPHTLVTPTPWPPPPPPVKMHTVQPRFKIHYIPFI